MKLSQPFLIWCLAAFTPPTVRAVSVGQGPSAELRAEVASAPQKANKALTDFLTRAGSKAEAEAPAAVTAAIQGLGLDATKKQIGAVVFTATRFVPESVLRIVRAAVLATPNADAPEIVTAATSAVPDPWKSVRYRRVVSAPEKGGRDTKGGPYDAAEAAPEAAQTPITLAEAIVQTALDARTGLDGGALQAAADVALLGDPSYLMQAMNDSRVNSPVGDVGNSNFGNEPVLPPTPPPVSR